MKPILPVRSALGSTDPAALPPASTGEHVVRGACPHDCPDTCALRVTVRDGRAVRVEGDPDHPPTDGVLCTKVSRYTERTYHPGRVLHPMRRVGPKGAGRFERATWDEALDDIARRLGEIARRDPQRIVPYSYAGTMGFVQGEGMGSRFFHALGASRLDRTICASAGAAGMAATLGGPVGMDVERFVDSRLILIWGSNPITSSVHFWRLAQEAKRRGARLVAIDPYRSDTAVKCHEHVALRPGTDAAFALGMAHVLIAEGLVDRDWVDAHALGYPEFMERASRWHPRRAAEVCGVPAEQVERLAIEYGSTRPAAIRLNYGMQRTRGGGNAVRAIACLPALAGAWRDSAGGLHLSSSGHFPVNVATWTRPDLIPRESPGRAPGALPRMVNMSTIGDALLRADPPIEALVVYNSNPVAVAPQSSEVLEGFRRDDLFCVVLEHFMTDTADHADWVLPATTQLEHFDVHKTYGHRWLLANRPAVASQGEALPNSEIFRRLAARLAPSLPSMGHPALAEDDVAIGRAAIDWADPRAAHGSYEQLLRDGWLKMAEAGPGVAPARDLPSAVAPFAHGGFPTPSGKVEMRSPRLAAAGLDPLPDWVPPHESRASTPALARRFPLEMISPPARNFMNSTFVNVESLRAAEREPMVDLHPADAAARGLVGGSMVRVFNDRGEFHARLRVSDRTRPEVATAWGIWWHKLAPGGRNVNAVTGQALTDLGNAPTFYDCLVEVEALEVEALDADAGIAAAPATVGAGA